jgi:Na+-driven multidrug efflux pump
MANFFVFFGVYGTAIVFNQTIETLVPHALATKKIEMTGHLLNRALFLWLIIFGCIAGGIINIDVFVVNILDWDEDDAWACKEYMVFLLPSLFFWGVCDIHRRFMNSYECFWTPAIAYSLTTVCHPVLAKYLLVNEKMGMRGLALA